MRMNETSQAVSPEMGLLIRDGCILSCKNPLNIHGEISIDLRLFATGLVVALKQAKLILWKRDLWNASLRGAAEAFRECKIKFDEFDDLAGNIHLWCFNAVRGEAMADVHGDPDWKNLLLVAILVTYFERKSQKTIQATTFFLEKEEPKKDGFRIIPLPALREGETTDGFHASICAALSFLKLKLTALQPAHLESKKKIRRLKKQFGELPDIRVVTLRRREKQDRLPQEHGPIEWQHKWIVQGHWRKQWYPSVGENRPIYIESYVKGPEDLPLLQHRETMYKVAR